MFDKKKFQVIGEFRGAEAFEMMESVTTGHAIIPSPIGLGALCSRDGKISKSVFPEKFDFDNIAMHQKLLEVRGLNAYAKMLGACFGNTGNVSFSNMYSGLESLERMRNVTNKGV